VYPAQIVMHPDDFRQLLTEITTLGEGRVTHVLGVAVIHD
jgi:hypothetical protein